MAIEFDSFGTSQVYFLSDGNRLRVVHYSGDYYGFELYSAASDGYELVDSAESLAEAEQLLAEIISQA